MKDRLRLLLDREGISSARLAALIDVQPSAVSHILSGRNKPGFDFIAKLLMQYPLLNPRWLLLGEGEPYGDNNNITPEVVEHLESFDMTDIFTEENNTVDNEKAVDEDTPQARPEIRPFAAISKKTERIVIFYSDKTFSEYLDESL